MCGNIDTRHQHHKTTWPTVSWNLYVNNTDCKIYLNSLVKDSQNYVLHSDMCIFFTFYPFQCFLDYYLQLEDDVISPPNFLSAIDQFIKQQTKKWVTLQFSELGFIAKLYHTSDLNRFTRFLVDFYAQRPVDYLLTDFARLLDMKDMPLRKPTLFQHMGQYSSLVLSKSQKMSKFIDKYFKNG